MSRLPDHGTQILVIGPGAIGTFVAARLARAGLPVAVACRTGEAADRINDSGLVSIDADGAATQARVRAVSAPEELTEHPEVVFLATKCANAVGALRTWIDVVPREVPVVSLQNGLMGDVLAPLVPGRYIDTVVHFPATLDGPGRSIQTGPGGFDVGVWSHDGRRSSDPEQAVFVSRVLAFAAPSQVTHNIKGAKWTKLIINSAMTTLGVVAGATMGEILKDARARDAFLAVVDEGYRAGTADRVRFEPVQRFRPSMFAGGAGSVVRRSALHALLRFQARKYKRHRSSSLQSLERGMRTEVDYLNGVIVQTGAARGVETPVNAALVDLVHELEAGTTTPGMALLDRLPSTRQARRQVVAPLSE